MLGGPDPSTYIDKIKAYTENAPIPLAILALNYERLHPFTLDSNWIYFQNGQYFDVLNRDKSPYIPQKLFAAAPIVSKVNGLMPSFTIPSDLIFSNFPMESVQFSLNFDDGTGWRIAEIDQALQASYVTYGEKTIQYKVTIGGETFFSQSKIHITQSTVLPRGGGMWSPMPDITLPITASKEFYNEKDGKYEKGEAEINIFFNCESSKLTKPLIIIEGYEEPGVTESSWERMIEILNRTEWAETSSNPSDNLTMHLYPEGYDLIYINFKDGSDYIQKNAFVVEEVIKKVNEMKAEAGSAEENVIIGVSMGGVAGKYALLDMEKNNLDHETKLYFTYDSPLRGANVPIGVQCFLRHIGDEIGTVTTNPIPQLQAVVDAIDRPTPRQLLKYHVDYMDGLLSEPINLEQVAFLAEMDALGDLEVKHVAIANGSANGTYIENNISPGSLMFSLFAEGEVCDEGFWFDIWDICANITIDIKIRATRDNVGSTRVYEGNFKIDKPWPASDVTSIRECNCITKGYDVIPGGSNNIAIKPLQDLGTLFADAGLPTPIVSSIATHCTFIPTYSAMDAPEPSSFIGNQSCGIADRCSTPISPEICPFIPGGTTPELNQAHIFLDKRIAELIIDEVITQQNLFGKVPSLLSTYYNIALPNDVRITTERISTSTGNLNINNSGKVAFATGNEPNATEDLISAYLACGTQLVVEDKASLVIGAKNKERHGVLNVIAGSSLTIKSGATLLITTGQSALIVKSGAHLIIEPGAKIILSDPNSELRIEEGATLELLGQPDFSGEGYWHFAGDNELVMGANMPTWFLKGTGKTKRMLMVEGQLKFPEGKNIDLQSGQVQYKNGYCIS